MVQHAEELKQHRQSKPQNEHEADGIDLYFSSGVNEIEVQNGDHDGDGGIEELEGECCHQPQRVSDEESEVYLRVMRKTRLIK